MRRIISVIALAASIAATPASASLWRLAARGGEAPQRSLFFVDIDSIRRTGNEMTLVTVSLFEGTTTNRDFDKSVVTRRANCASMSSQITRSEYYRAGKLLETSTTPGNMITHEVNSVMYGTLQAACGQRAYLGAPVTSPMPYWPAVPSYSPPSSTTSGKNQH
jgi:hypothetical protein